MDEELEPEVLSYREFRNREALLAWQSRRRAVESQRDRRGGVDATDVGDVDFVKPARTWRALVSPRPESTHR
jgi:hypothetical protein